jgi:hypothetical protein
MTYAKNSVILAADYNAMAGLTATAAASSAVATNVAGYLWGVGYGDRGYGETSPNLTAVAAGNTITSTQWVNLRSTINNLAAQQGTATTLLPTATVLASGATITSHRTADGNAYDLPAMLALVDANRLTAAVANMTVTSSAASSTRATTWGAGISSITCTFNVTFADENSARYFFNSGGGIRIALSHPDTTTPQNSSWNTILSNFNASFNANATTKLTGTYGNPQAIGYYQLTTAFQTIVDGTNAPGTGAYSVNDFIIQARATVITGLNGAKGSVLEFKVTLTDEHQNAFSDLVAAGTVATLGHIRATNLPNRPAPTCSVTTAF